MDAQAGSAVVDMCIVWLSAVGLFEDDTSFGLSMRVDRDDRTRGLRTIPVLFKPGTVRSALMHLEGYRSDCRGIADHLVLGRDF